MEKEVLNVSEKIWNALMNVDEDAFKNLVYPDAKFIHMGVMLDQVGEFAAAKDQKIITKNVDIKNSEVRIYGNTGIVLKRIDLTAIVLGEEHTNPFMVTEVYVRDVEWKLANLSYTKVMY